MQSQIHATQLQATGEMAIVSFMGLGVTALNQDLLNGLHNFEWLHRLSLPPQKTTSSNKIIGSKKSSNV